jgi:hypothetical protein
MPTYQEFHHMIRKAMICSLSFALLLSACGAPDGGDASGSAADGLSLTSSSDSSTSGEFREADLSVTFALSKNDDALIFAMQSSSGAPLLAVQQRGALMTSTFFGDRVSVTAPSALLRASRSLPESELRELLQNVSVTGDAAALDQIGQTPELALLGPLSDALVAAGLDSVLPQPEQLGRLELALADDTAQGDPGGGGDPDDDCTFFKQITCGGVLTACGAGCIGATAGYVACVLPCLGAASMAFCSDCI